MFKYTVPEQNRLTDVVPEQINKCKLYRSGTFEYKRLILFRNKSIQTTQIETTQIVLEQNRNNTYYVSPVPRFHTGSIAHMRGKSKCVPT